ncbi:histidine kinase [Roseivivax halodurans JCM 10272]|uniref:histidine kinase n=1 Tax=Roseivivax halodurans JCM 10272 TaxID=1449350 RepID=X7EMP5_9RHOB|nr:histidine kinase [Roseivivax halodurans JCM 10272]
MLVLRQIDEFSTAASDNVQWSLAQTDVEYLRYELAIADAEARATPATIEAIRRRFDVFYSRMSTLANGDVFELLRADPAFEDPRQEIEAHLQATIPLIDGPDADLLAALPQLAEDAAAISGDVRAMTLEGLASFANVSDSKREGLVRTLALLAAVLATIFAGLALVAVSLYRLMRLSDDRAREVQLGAARTRTIVETSLDSIFVIDASGHIAEMNGTARHMFGFDETEAGMPLERLFADAGEGHLREGPLSFLASGAAPAIHERRFEATAKDAHGRHFPAEISIGKADGEGDPVYIAYVRDISRRKIAEQGLTEARDRALAGERAKSEFLAVMSHEMRTPLNGLLGSMQLLRDHDLTERQTDLLDRMQSSGKLLLGLVNDVLDLTKLEAGKMEIERRPMSVARLLDGVVETVAPLATEAGDTLDWAWVGPARDACIGDQRRLRQVLLNLVGNAVKFTRDGSVAIEVEALGDNRTVEFRVIDTGVGISERDLERIFNDFETLDSSYSRQVGGTGLGLGISQRLVGLMEGEIGAESEQGEGSLFWVRVPIAGDTTDRTLSVARKAVAEPRPLPPLNLLLVEDNPINRAVAREMLEADGHRVTEAFDGAAGVDWARARRFDAILMDISMPVMDGIEAAREITRDGRASAGVPILAVTAHALPEEIDGFRAAGMAHIISKPIDRDELSSTLAAAVLPESERPASAAPVSQDAARLIDNAHLGAVWRDLPPAARETLLTRALAEIDETVTEVSGTDIPDDPNAVRETVHRAAGSCAALGFTAMHRALAEIETCLKRDGLVPSAPRDALPHLWSGTRNALEDWRSAA